MFEFTNDLESVDEIMKSKRGIIMVFSRVVNRVGFFLMKKKLNFKSKIKFQIKNYSIKKVRKHIRKVRKFFLKKYRKYSF